ncbi:Response regulator uvrY [Legionella pneumophila]|nr:Response regulator uvrY [Legionella pneumophila]
MIKVLIVDDHALVRMGIRRLLEDMSDVDVVADAESGEQALAYVKTHSPDVRIIRHENAWDRWVGSDTSFKKNKPKY